MRVLKAVSAVVLLAMLPACALHVGGERKVRPAFANSAASESAPVPVPTNPQPSAPQIGGTNMVHVGDGWYCPGGIAKQRVKQWAKVGAHPFSGSPAEAIAAFVEVPDMVRQQWLALVGANRGMTGIMGLRDRVCSMMYSTTKHKRWDNVVASWRDQYPAGTPRTQLSILKFVVNHGGFEWILLVPPRRTGGCDNWSYVARVPGQGVIPPSRAQSAPAVPPKPSAVVPPKPTPKPAPEMIPPTVTPRNSAPWKPTRGA